MLRALPEKLRSVRISDAGTRHVVQSAGFIRSVPCMRVGGVHHAKAELAPRDEYTASAPAISYVALAPFEVPSAGVSIGVRRARARCDHGAYASGRESAFPFMTLAPSDVRYITSMAGYTAPTPAVPAWHKLPLCTYRSQASRDRHWQEIAILVMDRHKKLADICAVFDLMVYEACGGGTGPHNCPIDKRKAASMRLTTRHYLFPPLPLPSCHVLRPTAGAVKHPHVGVFFLSATM